jgi:putative ABC transport system substrate-binding protein
MQIFHPGAFKRFMRCHRNAVSRIIFPLFFLLTVLIPVDSRADAERTVISVQSIAVRPYDEALEGFKEALSGVDIAVHRVFLSEVKAKDFEKQLVARKPRLILAIGMDALSRVAHLKHIPIVYVMVLDPAGTLTMRGQVTGVKMGVAPEKQLAILREALPQARTIGLLYDPQRSGRMVHRIEMVAAHNGISVAAMVVDRTEQVPKAVMEMTGKIDVFWMLPDLTVISPETVEFLLLFAMESRTPLLTFSEKYAEQGAVVTIASDPVDMGRQAGEMAAKMLAGVHAETIPEEDARTAMVTINLKVARKMGVTIGEKILRTARILD